MDIISHLKRKIRKYSNGSVHGYKILVAISGGVDSIVLSDAMSKAVVGSKNSIGLAHVNYGVRSDADDAEELCRQYAKGLKCIYHSTRIKFDGKGQSFEKWARDVRYSYLVNIAHDYGYHWIFTSHHRDDQIETLYMRYAQNADWITMQGIREQLGIIKRPLLCFEKQQLIAYAHEHSLRWMEDPTNKDLTILRNNIRHSILPEIFRSNPGLPDDLLRLSRNAKRRFNRLAGQLNIDELISGYDKYNYVEISKKKLLELNDDKRKIVIKSLVADYLGKREISLSGRHWASFWQFIRNASVGTIFDLYKDIFSLMDRGSIYLTCRKTLKPTRKKIKSNGITEWDNSQFKTTVLKSRDCLHSQDKKFLVIRSEIFENGVFIRQWKKGDSITVNDGKNNIKISNLFINHKIPVIKKRMYPVVVDGNDRILWIPGIRHASLKVEKDMAETNNIKIEWL